MIVTEEGTTFLVGVVFDGTNPQLNQKCQNIFDTAFDSARSGDPSEIAFRTVAAELNAVAFNFDSVEPSRKVIY